MADTMRAERFYADTNTVVLENVPIPEPGPGEVLVRLDLSRSISRIIPLEDIRDGIAALERAEGNPIRIIVQP